MIGARRAVWGGLIVVTLVALLAVWFLTAYDREFFEERGPWAPAAQRNYWLSTEMLLARFGYRAVTTREASDLDRIPKGGTLILSNQRQYQLTPSRTAALLAWVEAGGLLIADVSAVTKNDPIVKAFDARLAPPAPSPETERDKHETESDGDGDANDDAAAAKAKREPPRRSVDVPGYGRTLRMRASSAPLHPGRIEPAWKVAGVTDRKGHTEYEILAYDRGAGRVVLVNGLWRFNAFWLGADDHAELLLALIATHQRDGDVHILARLVTPSLFEWLRDHAGAMLASAAVLFAFWLWRIIPRFGAPRPEPSRARRGLALHLRAVGRFLWRHGAAVVLLDAARGSVRRDLGRRGLVPADGNALPVGEIARVLGLSEPEVTDALLRTPASNPQYAAAMATLHDISRKLNEPASP